MTPKKCAMMTGIPDAVSPALNATEAIFDEDYWEQKAKRYLSERDAALALAERRAGERDRLRDWLNIAKQFVWDEEIVENIDAELAGASPETATDENALQQLVTAATRLCAVSWDNDGRLWEMRCELRDVLESLGGAPPPATTAQGVTVVIKGVPRHIETATITREQAAELGLFAVPKGDGDGDRHGD